MRVVVISWIKVQTVQGAASSVTDHNNADNAVSWSDHWKQHRNNNTGTTRIKNIKTTQKQLKQYRNNTEITQKLQKQHRNNTETTQKLHRNNRNKTEITQKQHRNNTETTQKQHRNNTEIAQN